MRGLLIAGVLVLTSGVRAEPRDADKAEADQLFFEGRQLLAQDKRVEACAKFDLSFRKDPRAVGTILNLGLCGEMSGEIATSVRYYAEARDRARDQDLKEYQDAAERKIALLSPRVPHVAIVLAEPLPAMRVLLDNAVLSIDELGDVMVDPGKRTIVVTARGRLPYETKLEVKEGAHATVTIPRLESGKTVIVEQSSRALWGKVTLTSGLGLLAIGSGFALLARHSYWEQFPAGSQDGLVVRDAMHDCWTDRTTAGAVVRKCDALGSKTLASARTTAHVGSAFAIIGAVAVVTGAYIWWRAPSRVSVVPTASTESAGVAISGAF